MGLGGAGASVTGGGAILGVPVCVAGVALATNGAVTFINGAKTVIVAVCHWNELPAAADTPALASATLRPPAGGAVPAVAQATAGNASPAAAAKGIKPAAQQAASTPPTGQTPAQTAKPTTSTAPFTHTVTKFKCTGQMHYAITSKIHTALERHPLLKGLYKYRDDRFVTQALNKEAHMGYQKWHRDMETQVVNWIKSDRTITPAQFEAWLRNLYKTDKTLDWRFPNGF
jgi:hypothetical protein